MSPILKRWELDERKRRAEGHEHGCFDPVRAVAPLAYLAEQVGTTPDHLYRISVGRGTTLDFDLCDALLCAMNLVHLWWEKPLASVYQRIDLRDPRTRANERACELRAERRAERAA
jgi:hypothetical protein